ncbi:MAG: DinB family protein, partial [Pirellulaceae bacterium]
YQEQRAGTLAALAKLSDEDLDKPSPEAIQSYAPNVAAAFSMQGSHWLMHAGQWAVVRRQLGKPPLF